MTDSDTRLSAAERLCDRIVRASVGPQHTFKANLRHWHVPAPVGTRLTLLVVLPLETDPL